MGMEHGHFEVLRKVILKKEQPTGKDLRILLEGTVGLISETRKEVRDDLLTLSKTPQVLMNDPSPEGETLSRFFRLAENESSNIGESLREILLFIRDHLQTLFFESDSDSAHAFKKVIAQQSPEAFSDLQKESQYLGAKVWDAKDPFAVPVGYKANAQDAIDKLMPTSTVRKTGDSSNIAAKAQLPNDIERSIDELGILSSQSEETLRSSDLSTHSTPSTQAPAPPTLEPDSYAPFPIKIAKPPTQSASPTPIPSSYASDNEEHENLKELEEKVRTQAKHSSKPIPPLSRRKSARLQGPKVRSASSPSESIAPSPSPLFICLGLIFGFALGLSPYLLTLSRKEEKKEATKVGPVKVVKKNSADELEIVAFLADWDKQLQRWTSKKDWAAKGKESLDQYLQKQNTFTERLEAQSVKIQSPFQSLAKTALYRVKNQISCLTTLMKMNTELQSCDPPKKGRMDIVESQNGFALKRTLACHNLLLEAGDFLGRSGEKNCQKILQNSSTIVRDFEYKVIKHYVTTRKRLRNRDGILSILRQAAKEIAPDEVALKEEILQSLHELSK
jgi:hypothetical protein